MAACRPWLERQIALLKPKVIVLLGKAAVHSVLHDDGSLGSLRGRRFEYQGIPVVVTYHPAYLLRNLPEKAKAWEDLLFARRCLRETIARGAGNCRSSTTDPKAGTSNGRCRRDGGRRRSRAGWRGGAGGSGT